jgi:hypothetical protein
VVWPLVGKYVDRPEPQATVVAMTMMATTTRIGFKRLSNTSGRYGVNWNTRFEYAGTASSPYR